MLSTDRLTAPVWRTLSSIQFDPQNRIAIALSGGGDSTALLRLVHGYFDARGEAGCLVAVTVDHGLRAESSAEARLAGEVCAKLGIPHEIKEWRGEKPATGLQAAARDARYRLLAEVAAAHDCGIVLTGHTLDDQAETVAMRGKRGSGRGLSGIAPATLYERRTWFVRPLIGHRRSQLRDWLSGMGQTWMDDPSNCDTRFERVRLRGGDVATADAGAFRAAFEARRAEARNAAAILGDESLWHLDGAARSAELQCDPASDADGFLLALSVVLSWVGHGTYLPPVAVVEKAAAFCRTALPGKRMTAAGCLLTKAGGRVRIGREQRNRRDDGYGYDHLLPSPDFDVAQALAVRAGEPRFPSPPISGYLD